MARFVAFLRGVNPLNAKMPQLKRAFEGAGFTNVKTLLSSGNVVFDAGARSESAVEMRAPRVKLPLCESGAKVLCQIERDLFSAYVRSDEGPVFMKLIDARTAGT